MHTDTLVAFMILVIVFEILLWVNLLICILLIVFGNIIYEKCGGNNSIWKSSVRELELRKKIAVAAVATALRVDNDPPPHTFPLPATAFVSAWQAVMRSDILKRQGRPR